MTIEVTQADREAKLIAASGMTNFMRIMAVGYLFISSFNDEAAASAICLAALLLSYTIEERCRD